MDQIGKMVLHPAPSSPYSPPPPENAFFRFDTFFKSHFKNIFNLIFPGFKVQSKIFLFKDFKKGLLFGFCDFSIFKI